MARQIFAKTLVGRTKNRFIFRRNSTHFLSGKFVLFSNIQIAVRLFEDEN